MSRATLQDRLKLLFILHIKELTARKQSSLPESLENSANTIESSEWTIAYVKAHESGWVLPIT